MDRDGKPVAELAAAQSDLAQQQAAYQIAAFDKDAYTRLAKTGAVSERQGLQSAATADQSAAAVAAAQRLEASQHLVGPPVLRQLHRGSSEVPRILFQLSLKAAE